VARSLVVLPWAMPTFASAFAWRWMLDYNYGAVNQTLERIGLHAIPFLADNTVAFVVAVVVYVWKELPWAVLVMLAGLQSVPTELREAARVDGATARQEYFHVVIPSMAYVVQIVVLLLFIWEFTWFDMMWLLTNGGPGTATMVLPITIYRDAFYGFNMGTASAIASIMLVVLLGVALLYIRTWREEEASL
jgi:multiple sugar transport system permease protein